MEGAGRRTMFYYCIPPPPSSRTPKSSFCPPSRSQSLPPTIPSSLPHPPPSVPLLSTLTPSRLPFFFPLLPSLCLSPLPPPPSHVYARFYILGSIPPSLLTVYSQICCPSYWFYPSLIIDCVFSDMLSVLLVLFLPHYWLCILRYVVGVTGSIPPSLLTVYSQICCPCYWFYPSLIIDCVFSDMLSVLLVLFLPHYWLCILRYVVGLTGSIPPSLLTVYSQICCRSYWFYSSLIIDCVFSDMLSVLLVLSLPHYWLCILRYVVGLTGSTPPSLLTVYSQICCRSYWFYPSLIIDCVFSDMLSVLLVLSLPHYWLCILRYVVGLTGSTPPSLLTVYSQICCRSYWFYPSLIIDCVFSDMLSVLLVLFLPHYWLCILRYVVGLTGSIPPSLLTVYSQICCRSYWFYSSLIIDCVFSDMLSVLLVLFLPHYWLCILRYVVGLTGSIPPSLLTVYSQICCRSYWFYPSLIIDCVFSDMLSVLLVLSLPHYWLCILRYVVGLTGSIPPSLLTVCYIVGPFPPLGAAVTPPPPPPRCSLAGGSNEDDL